MLTSRTIPDDHNDIKFNWTNSQDFGMINLSSYQNDINKLDNLDDIVSDSTSLNIHFPLFDKFFVEKHNSESGFTLKELITSIVETGLSAGEYDTLHYPEHYNVSNPNAHNFIDRYAILSSTNKSGIVIKDNNVYVSVSS